MNILNFFSSIFGKTHKRKHFRGKKYFKSRKNKKHNFHFMKGG